MNEYRTGWLFDNDRGGKSHLRVLKRHEHPRSRVAAGESASAAIGKPGRAALLNIIADGSDAGRKVDLCRANRSGRISSLLYMNILLLSIEDET